MRTYDVVVGIGLIALAFGLSPAASFDGTPSEDLSKAPALESRGLGSEPALGGPTLQALPPSGGIPRPPNALPQGSNKLPPSTGSEALRSGTRALRDGKPDQAMAALEDAAEQWVPGARWKLVT